MVDAAARRTLTERPRRLANGWITNEDFDDAQSCGAQDRAVWQIG
jgi:hypothetical protein